MKQLTILLLCSVLSVQCSLAQDYYIFKWQQEPRENAFKVLVPEEWTVEGGIFRIDPTTGDGAANAIEAKLDFTMKKDNAGTAMMRWYPDMYYFDARHSPAGQMGLYPTGSNYNGMIVIPLLPPYEFITSVLLPYAHPDAASISITEQKPLPELARAVEKEDKLIFDMGFTYAAAMVAVTYTENGKEYEEKFVTVIMNLGQAGAGMWKNRYTWSVRAPKGRLDDYEPIFAAIGNSLTLNMQWVSGEIKGQLERAGITNKTMDEINRIGREITSHRQKTNEIIQNDAYLALTAQEEYVNPYTNEVEMGTNQWNHRWSSNSDFVIYSDDPNFNPNQVPALSHFEYKRSPVKPRSAGD